jgi:class 3 adenylate cyclase
MRRGRGRVGPRTRDADPGRGPTGEVEVANGDLRGIAIHIGSRVSRLAGPSEVLVSRTVADLVAGSGIVLVDRGEHELRGVPGSWQVYAVEGA